MEEQAPAPLEERLRGGGVDTDSSDDEADVGGVRVVERELAGWERASVAEWDLAHRRFKYRWNSCRLRIDEACEQLAFVDELLEETRSKRRRSKRYSSSGRMSAIPHVAPRKIVAVDERWHASSRPPPEHHSLFPKKSSALEVEVGAASAKRPRSEEPERPLVGSVVGAGAAVAQQSKQHATVERPRYMMSSAAADGQVVVGRGGEKDNDLASFFTAMN